MEGTIGEIRLFAAPFAPKNWALCQGQLLSIQQNTALFSILGTTYGGDGQVTFALPDFRGRLAVGVGQGGGLSSYTLGEVAGSENVTLLGPQIPGHTHTFLGTMDTSGSADNTSPGGNYLAPGPSNIYGENGGAPGMATAVSGQAGQAGNSQPHNNVQPSLGMNVIICMYGLYPSRN